MVACAVGYFEGGYKVIVDDIVGSWFLSPWIDAAKAGIIVHYVVIRPDLNKSSGKSGIATT